MNNIMHKPRPISAKQSGFTLIEVLIALAIVAISLSALLTATAQTVTNTRKLKEKTISNWVAEQGIIMIQLGLLMNGDSKKISEATTLLGETWYWQGSVSPTPIQGIEQIQISMSKNLSGPFVNTRVGYRYVS